jgi:hypothetical protein
MTLSEKERYQEAAKLICRLLDGQRLFIGPVSLIANDGSVNARALGYVYGFTACFLQIAKLDIRSDYGRSALLFVLNQFDTSNADLLFDYLAHAPAPFGAELLDGVMIGGVDYNDWVESKGKKITLRWRECFAAR